MVDLDTFLAPVVTEVINMADIRTQEQNKIDSDDAVLTWARQAYRRACSYCNRPLMNQSIVDRYPDVKENRVALRVSPVTAISAVRIVGEDSDLGNDDYERDYSDLVLNSIIFGERLVTSLEEGCGEEYYDLRVSYTGGYALANSDETLLGALAKQTLLWWRQKEMQAFTNAARGGSAEKRTVVSVSQLNLNVREMLDKFMYLGSGYEEV